MVWCTLRTRTIVHHRLTTARTWLHRAADAERQAESANVLKARGG
jgi:hypothetical protein